MFPANNEIPTHINSCNKVISKPDLSEYKRPEILMEDDTRKSNPAMNKNEII